MFFYFYGSECVFNITYDSAPFFVCSVFVKTFVSEEDEKEEEEEEKDEKEKKEEEEEEEEEVF